MAERSARSACGAPHSLRAARVAAGSFALACGLAAQWVAAAPVDAIAPPLLEELHDSGLIGGAAQPVRPFTWTVVLTRPLRSPRRQRETYAGTPPGAPVGLSPMVRDELTEAGTIRRTVRGVSVRGLVFVKPGDTSLEVRVHDLKMPLATGQRFRIEYDEDGGELAEDCRVDVEVAAATIHPSIPGRATRIECRGSGRYRRIPVRVSATVMYLHAPGVFVGVEQAIDSPLGRLRSGVRVVEFSMQGN